MFCPICGNEAKPGHRFCYKCGNFLPEEFELAPLEQAPGEEAAPTETVEIPVVHTETVPVSAYQPRKGRLWPAFVVLAVMIALGLTAFFLFPYPDTTQPVYSETPWFVIDDGVLYFDDSHYLGNGELTIPEIVDDQTVVAIGENAFADCDDLTTVILPGTITEIHANAFAECDNLRGIYIPESVKVIADKAFYGCDGLEAIYLTEKLEQIGHEAFSQCQKLNYILYNGTYKQWKELYSDPFSGPVELHTKEGTYHIGP